MTVTNVIYARYNMAEWIPTTNNARNEKYANIYECFHVFPNSYPSGLTYYYFLSTLITIIITTIMKKVIDEERILAQLEANKKKPKKKKLFHDWRKRKTTREAS